jgi:hypothetical protein
MEDDLLSPSKGGIISELQNSRQVFPARIQGKGRIRRIRFQVWHNIENYGTYVYINMKIQPAIPVKCIECGINIRIHDNGPSIQI